MSFASGKAAFATALPFPWDVAPRSGSENRHWRDGPSASGASIDERDAGGKEGWSDPVTDGSEDKSGSVESIIGVGEGDHETSRSSKGALLSAVCSSKVAASGGKVDVIEPGGGVYTERSGVRKCVV